MSECCNRNNRRLELMCEQQQCIVVKLLQNDHVKVQMVTLDQLLHFGIVECVLGADQTGPIKQQQIVPVAAVLQIEYIVDWNFDQN